MAIVPFRACRYPLTSEQLPHPAQTTASATKVDAVPDSTATTYSYCHRHSGSDLRGIVALLEGESIAQLRSPMPADPADVELARECLRSKHIQPAPVLALYDTPPLPAIERHVSALFAADDALRIEPVCDSLIATELNSALANLPLTVIAGQEWIAAADGQPLMVLLVNQSTWTPELLPVHRTVRWHAGWHAGDMVRLGREHFFFHDISRLMPRIGEAGPHYFAPTAQEYLRPRVPGENVYIAVTARHTFRIHSLPGWADTVLAHRSPEERAIGTVQLHEILFTKGLQMPTGSADDTQVSYTDNRDEAVARVNRGDVDVAFLMNAPTLEQIVAVARTGGSVPPQTFRLRLAPVSGAIGYAF